MLSKYLKLWLPVILWMGLIFKLSSIPDLKTDLKEDFILRKLAHVTEYFILSFLFYRACKGTWKNTTNILYTFPFTLAFLYAASDEFHQSFIQGRTGVFQDVLIDSIGIIGFFILLFLKNRINSSP